jgi:hypothetical protein
MSDEGEHIEGEKAAQNFRQLVKRAVSVPKSEIDKRAEEWRAAREAERSDKSEE